MKKITALVLVLILILSSFSFNICAIDTDIYQTFDSSSAESRATGLILSYSLYLTKTGTTLKLTGLTNCSLDVVRCGFKNLTVERRKTSSDSWEDYYEYGNLYAETDIANLNTTLTVPSGYQYRISCKHYAKKSLLVTQTVSNTSNIVTVS